MSEFEAQVNELRNNPTEIREMLSQMEHLQDQLETANQTIKNEQHVFKLLERAVDEQPNALEIWKKYAELRDRYKYATNPGK